MIGDKCVILCLYVDNILIFGFDISVIYKSKSYLSKNFGMKVFGQADVILGIKIIKTSSGICWQNCLISVLIITNYFVN